MPKQKVLNIPDLVTDEARLAALAGYDILDTPPEPGFDDVVQLATMICDAPVALVSLVAADRQWFKARIGFEPCETDLASSVCAHALVEPDLLVIPDLTQDPRSSANPLVTGDPKIRFYAGAPLRTADGHVLGSLCVIDGAPRPDGLTTRQAEALRNLARQVVSLLELRRALVERGELSRRTAEADARRRGLFEIGEKLRDAESMQDMIRAASEIIGRTLGVVRVGFGRLDATTEHIDVVSDWSAEGIASIVGRHRFDDYGDLRASLLDGMQLVIEDVRVDPRTAANPGPMLALGIGSLVNAPVMEHGRMVALLLVHAGEPRVWSPETLSFIRNVADRVQASAARLRAEGDQRVLNEEISHRMKNMMAMIQAIAIQTLKGVPDKAPVDALMKRIQALSVAHDVLLDRSWAAAELSAVAAAVLGAFGREDQISLSGPSLDLGPRSALSASLLLHELATNAVKYGALSVGEGTVAVNWRIEAGASGEEVVLDWRESGGPPASAPTRRGFGSRLIQMGLVGTGGGAIRYAPMGLEAEFRAPVEQVRQS